MVPGNRKFCCWGDFSKNAPKCRQNPEAKVSSKLGNWDLIRTSRFARYQLPRWKKVINDASSFKVTWLFQGETKTTQPEIPPAVFFLKIYIVTMMTHPKGFIYQKPTPTNSKQALPVCLFQWAWKMNRWTLAIVHLGPKILRKNGGQVFTETWVNRSMDRAAVMIDSDLGGVYVKRCSLWWNAVMFGLLGFFVGKNHMDSPKKV